MKYILLLILLTSCSQDRSNSTPMTGDPQTDYRIMQLNLEKENNYRHLSIYDK